MEVGVFYKGKDGKYILFKNKKKRFLTKSLKAALALGDAESYVMGTRYKVAYRLLYSSKYNVSKIIYDKGWRFLKQNGQDLWFESKNKIFGESSG